VRWPEHEGRATRLARKAKELEEGSIASQYVSFFALLGNFWLPARCRDEWLSTQCSGLMNGKVGPNRRFRKELHLEAHPNVLRRRSIPVLVSRIVFAVTGRLPMKL
jgi:hypothetical protein